MPSCTCPPRTPTPTSSSPARSPSAIDSAELYVAWTPEQRPAPSPRSSARAARAGGPQPRPLGVIARACARSRPATSPPLAPRRLPAAGRAARQPRVGPREAVSRGRGLTAVGRSTAASAGVRGRRLAARRASSPSGGLAPSRAHGSSNSTRHLPSSLCCEREPRAERLARAALEAGDRPRGAARGDQLLARPPAAASCPPCSSRSRSRSPGPRATSTRSPCGSRRCRGRRPGTGRGWPAGCGPP